MGRTRGGGASLYYVCVKTDLHFFHQLVQAPSPFIMLENKLPCTLSALDEPRCIFYQFIIKADVDSTAHSSGPGPEPVAGVVLEENIRLF